MGNGDWMEAVLKLLANYLEHRHPEKGDDDFDSDFEGMYDLLQFMIGTDILDLVMVGIQQIFENPDVPFPVRYDRKQKRYRLNCRQAFMAMRDPIIEGIKSQARVPINDPELIRRVDGRIERIIACVIDAYHKPLCWKDLDPVDHQLAEEVSTQFMILSAQSSLRRLDVDRVVHAPDEALEPRLRVFMNTLAQNEGKMPDWYEQILQAREPESARTAFDA